MEWNCSCPPLPPWYDDEHLYVTCKEAPTRYCSDIDTVVCLFGGALQGLSLDPFLIRNAHSSIFAIIQRRLCSSER